LSKNKIQVYLDYQIKDIKTNKISIVNNTTHSSISLSFDTLLVQYGQKVDHSLFTNFKNLHINEQKRIHVGIEQMTNINNVYAIGNVCIYKDKPSSIICAHGEAAVAIRSIINKLKKYD
jgi:thioredoxin reductase (NADPH)